MRRMVLPVVMVVSCLGAAAWCGGCCIPAAQTELYALWKAQRDHPLLGLDMDEVRKVSGEPTGVGTVSSGELLWMLPEVRKKHPQESREFTTWHYAFNTVYFDNFGYVVGVAYRGK